MAKTTQTKKQAQKDAPAILRRFAKNITAIREKKGWSQGDVAEKTGYVTSYVSMLERAKRTATLATVDTFARTFQVRPETLLAEPQKEQAA